jgi:arylsulfatase A-like enzyme
VNLLDTTVRAGRDAVFGETHSIHNMTPGQPDETLQYLWCVENEWKLILRFHGKDTTRYRDVHAWDTVPVQLFRIREDPGETRNLATEHPDIVTRLREMIAAWHAVPETPR